MNGKLKKYTINKSFMLDPVDDEDVLDLFQTLRETKRMNQSDVIRQALKELVKKYQRSKKA